MAAIPDVAQETGGGLRFHFRDLPAGAPHSRSGKSTTASWRMVQRVATIRGGGAQVGRRGARGGQRRAALDLALEDRPQRRRAGSRPACGQ